MRHIISLFTQAIHLHFEGNELEHSPSIPSFMPTGMEQLPPIPRSHMDELAQSIPTIERRLEDDHKQRQIWVEEYPRALAKLCATFCVIIQQVSQSRLMSERITTEEEQDHTSGGEWLNTFRDCFLCQLLPIAQRLDSEPTWSDAFGELHISIPPHGQLLKPTTHTIIGSELPKAFGSIARLAEYDRR